MANREHMKQRIAAWFLFSALAVFFIAGALDYGVGTLNRMGAGFFPAALGAILCGMACIQLLRSEPTPAEAELAFPWRPVLCTFAAILCFAGLVTFAGLGPAVFGTVVLAMLGDRESRLPAMLLCAIAVTGIAWLIFKVGLGLPVPFFRFG